MSYLKPRNLLLLVALLLALALIVVIALRYSPGSQLKQLAETLPEGVDVALSDIDYRHIEAGKALWQLQAKRVARDSSSKTLGLNLPVLTFFDEQGAVKGSLQAGRGEVSEDYQRISLHGDVILTSSAGYALYTDHMDYDHTTGLATTDAAVRMVAGEMTLEGRGLSVDLRRERLHLAAEVKGLFHAERLK